MMEKHRVNENRLSILPVWITVEKPNDPILQLKLLQEPNDVIMEIKQFIDQWIAASNSFNTKEYLDFYHDKAVLDDPSVGRKFTGKTGIKEYFESYFIGYQTRTEKIDLIVKDKNHARLQVSFKGNFAEGKLGGSFEFTFRDGKILFVTADLIS